MSDMTSMKLYVFFVAVLVHQCSGQDKYGALVRAAVEYIPPSGPLFTLNTVTEGL